MEIVTIENKGYNLSIILNGFACTKLDTITNTVTIQKKADSETANSTFDTAITIRKQIPISLNVNNKK